MIAIRAAVAGLLVLSSATWAGADPVEIILEVALSPPGELGDPTFNVVGLYGSDFFGPSTEQYPASLEAKLTGHIRVRIDPDNPQSIEFVGKGSYLTLSTGDAVHLASVTEDSLA